MTNNNMLASLEKLHPDIVQGFLDTGETSAMPIDMQQFVRQIQWAAEIYETERNINRAARMLRLRIVAEQHQTIPLSACKARFYTAISYFAIDNNVATKVWETDYANKYEDLARLALASDDIKTAKRCFDSARDCRVRASEASDKEASWAPVFILSPDISLMQLGFEKRNIRQIAKKHNDGYYAKLIDSLPVDTKEKQRLFSDANITDVEEIECD